jgi:hypothetical protein
LESFLPSSFPFFAFSFLLLFLSVSLCDMYVLDVCFEEYECS